MAIKKLNLKDIQAKINKYRDGYDRAKSAWKTNPYSKYFFTDNDKVLHSCVEAHVALTKWKIGVKDLFNPNSIFEGLLRQEEEVAKFFVSSQDSFLDAAIIFEFVSYFQSPLNLTLNTNGVSGKGKPNVKARQKQLDTARQIINACGAIRDGIRTLNKYGIFPGPGNIGYAPSIEHDVQSILEAYEADNFILNKIPISRVVNGVEQEYRTTKKSRYKDGPRYLLLHLQELLSSCLGVSRNTVTPILLPLASQIGAIEPSAKNFDSLTRKLKNCDHKSVKRDFLLNYSKVASTIPKLNHTYTLNNLIKKLDKKKR